jgi:NADH dehydrogenase [ubiquinone] 1 alpha subcomplex assembly factor 5
METGLFDFGLFVHNQGRHLKKFPEYNFLYHEVADLIIENLLFHNRDFDEILEINSRDGYLSNAILELKQVKKLVKTNFVADFFNLDQNKDSRVVKKVIDTNLSDFVKEKFSEQKFDLIISNLDFHYLEDVSSFLIAVKGLLKKDGIFIASFFGQDNLLGLKKIFLQTESELYGSVSPRFAPTIDVKTAAHLLQKTGFANPISDLEKINISYQNPLALLNDIKLMGQANIMRQRSKKFISKRFLQEIIRRYQEEFGDDQTLEVNADFEIITVIGQNI